MCVTSPPYYGLRDYGGEENQIGMEESPEKYVDQLVEVFRNVREVLFNYIKKRWVVFKTRYYME